MAEVTLKALKREGTGKQAAKHLRLEGSIPGVLYGKEIDNTALSIDLKELVTILHSSGRNAVVNLMIGKAKKEIKSFIYEIQHDPIVGNITHVDLKQISMTEKIHVNVPVRLVGIPAGVRVDAGITEHVMHTIDISCLPLDIPDEFPIDITEMNIGDSVHVKDIKVEKFDVLADADSLVVHVIAPKIYEEELEEEEEGLEEEEDMEPEVIGQETEE